MLFLIAIALQNSLKWGIVIPPALLFFAEYCLGYLRSLVFPNEIWGRFFSLCDESLWVFDENCIKHVDCFWYYCHFCYVDSTNP
jgi:hypothetical protein